MQLDIFHKKLKSEIDKLSPIECECIIKDDFQRIVIKDIVVKDNMIYHEKYQYILELIASNLLSDSKMFSKFISIYMSDFSMQDFNECEWRDEINIRHIILYFLKNKQ